MTDVERTYLLRHESGSQLRMKSIGKSRFVKRGEKVNTKESGIPIECVVTASNYKEVDTSESYINIEKGNKKKLNLKIEDTWKQLANSTVKAQKNLKNFGKKEANG